MIFCWNPHPHYIWKISQIIPVISLRIFPYYLCFCFVWYFLFQILYASKNEIISEKWENPSSLPSHLTIQVKFWQRIWSKMVGFLWQLKSYNIPINQISRLIFIGKIIVVMNILMMFSKILKPTPRFWKKTTKFRW